MDEIFTAEDEAGAMLANLPRQTALALAGRAALRAWPVMFIEGADTEGHPGLIAARAILVTLCEANHPGPRRDEQLEAADGYCLTSLPREGEGMIQAPAATAAQALMAVPATGEALATRLRIIFDMAVRTSTVAVSARGWRRLALSDANIFDPLNAELWPGIWDDAPRHQGDVGAEITDFWRAYEPAWVRFCIYSDANEEWSFWQRWFQGFLDGAPLDWDLQRDIALLPNELWRLGPRAIAEAIAEREARHGARHAAGALHDAARDPKSQIETRPSGAAGNFGHNRSPEPLDDDALPRDDLALLARVASTVATQSYETEPDVAALEGAEAAGREIETRLKTWLAKKADVAADAAIKTLATAATGTAIGYVAHVLGVLSPFLEALRTWLGALY